MVECWSYNLDVGIHPAFPYPPNPPCHSAHFFPAVQLHEETTLQKSELQPQQNHYPSLCYPSDDKRIELMIFTKLPSCSQSEASCQHSLKLFVHWWPHCTVWWLIHVWSACPCRLSIVYFNLGLETQKDWHHASFQNWIRWRHHFIRIMNQ